MIRVIAAGVAVYCLVDAGLGTAPGDGLATGGFVYLATFVGAFRLADLAEARVRALLSRT